MDIYIYIYICRYRYIDIYKYRWSVGLFIREVIHLCPSLYLSGHPQMCVCVGLRPFTRAHSIARGKPVIVNAAALVGGFIIRRLEPLRLAGRHYII